MKPAKQGRPGMMMHAEHQSMTNSSKLFLNLNIHLPGNFITREA
jgi:hypothetical protein